MKPAQLFLPLAISFFIMACASSLRYASDYPLSAKEVRSRDGAFTGRIPQGWFSSSDDSLAPALAAWLIRDDFSATLAIREIMLDQLTGKQIKKEGLELLARSMIGMHGDSKGAGVIDEPKMFEVAGKKFCGYEVHDDSISARVVVFEGNGRYYECEAKPSKGKWTREDVILLYATQQTFLATLTF